jgi:Domain of unknown function (DUF4397)
MRPEAGYLASSHHHTFFGEEKMKNCIRTIFALALLCAALSTASLASSLYIVQGIPGRDYANLTDPAFPVDILLNGEVCYVHGLAFGTVSGPLTFDPGTYNIKVSVANTLAPCTNDPLIDRSVTIAPESGYSAVIALNSEGTPQMLLFHNTMTPVAANTARIVLEQAANAPTLQVTLTNTSTQKTYSYTVNRGGILSETLPSGFYTITIAQGATTLVAATPLTLDSQSATLLYTLGQSANNTVVLESKTLRDVI